MAHDETRSALRQAVVSHQLDDLNALGDALAAATQENNAEQLVIIRASIARYVLGLGWHAETALPAILAYVDEHSEFDDDLFGPAFILQAIAPEHAETTALLARLPKSVRELLALAGRA
jgi:hypothetical protein